MECNEIRRLLDADVDGELDLIHHLELEAHLRACPECAQLAERIRARRTALRESLPRFTAPPQLAEKIRAAIGAQPAGVPLASATPARASTPPSAPRAKILFPLWRAAGLAASISLALLAGYSWGRARARSNFLFDEAISSHVRSLQANHLTDVASTDQHTVKPWFAGKLDFSPPVVDLAASGFPLIGGRLEHIDGRLAAALIFRRRLHTINLFIWPASRATISSRDLTRDGYNTESWSQADLNFLAVSEIPASELAQFAAAFRAGTR
jgi:anti-sigma factor RsiW